MGKKERKEKVYCNEEVVEESFEQTMQKVVVINGSQNKMKEFVEK